MNSQKTNITLGKDNLVIDSEAWLWCVRCERFFQAKDLKINNYGDLQGCGTPRCKGSGYKIDIFAWDAWASNSSDPDDHWPKSVDELEKGMKCSLSK